MYNKSGKRHIDVQKIIDFNISFIFILSVFWELNVYIILNKVYWFYTSFCCWLYINNNMIYEWYNELKKLKLKFALFFINIRYKVQKTVYFKNNIIISFF